MLESGIYCGRGGGEEKVEQGKEMRCVCIGFDLNSVVRVGLTEQMKFEGGEEQPCRYLGKDHAGREKSQCKGPEAGECLLSLRSSKVATVAGGR